MIGRTIAHYQILEKLGEGGMGIVYKARDTHLDRFVALKVLPAGKLADPDRKSRFVQEAKAASALNHPNIITIYDIAQEDGVDFIVMEYVHGKTLTDLIGTQSLALNRALDFGTQISNALAAAHAAGIIHRDVKPGNVMVTEGGLVKILDFGLAKLTQPEPTPATETKTFQPGAALTKEGTVLGTVGYMSPEQVEGKKLDARSDIFSFGAVLYEMLTGHRAFQGESSISTMSAILRDSPPRLKDAPREVERILRRCLEKNREARCPSAAELSHALQSIRPHPVAGLFQRLIRRPRVAIPALAAVFALCFAGLRLYQHSARTAWAKLEAIPEIMRLTERQEYPAAFRLAREVERYIPEDPSLKQLWPQIAREISVETNPPGANVWVKQYSDIRGEWQHLGQSPIRGVKIPMQYCRWRAGKDGYGGVETAELYDVHQPARVDKLRFELQPEGSIPSGMVRVPTGARSSGERQTLPGPESLNSYLIDRFEVTNREFKKFADAGGYEKREYWKQEFEKNGRSLSWQEAMAGFRDTTGRPGPSTWALGTYPDGQDDFPVGGVSWYEAAAYAEYAGKSLPTVYHWYHAAGTERASHIVPLSNFGPAGAARAGAHEGISPFGVSDMAGNVKEWCWNASGKLRYVLGGAWGEPIYMFGLPDARSPFDRSPTNGFRCVKYDGPGDPAARLTGPVDIFRRDYAGERPASDKIFQVYRGLYRYDRTELNARVESVDDSPKYWRKEKITFDAAYGNERVIAYLFLPKQRPPPPYQAVVFFPGLTAFQQRSSDNLGQMHVLEPFIRGGRAVLYPIYKGSYERGSDNSRPRRGGIAARDAFIMRVKDLGRSLDYLETRPDILREKMAYFGTSYGAMLGSVSLAAEDRLKTGILRDGGLPFFKALPEIDSINFVPRIKVPVLMLNGRYDYLFPLETSQLPQFRLLGTPDKDKRHVVLERGHSGALSNGEIREIFDWLDRHLGLVK